MAKTAIGTMTSQIWNELKLHRQINVFNQRDETHYLFTSRPGSQPAGWLRGPPTAEQARRPADRPADQLAGWPAGQPAGELARHTASRLAGWVVGRWVVDWWWVVGGGCDQLTYAQSRIYTYEIGVVTAPILYWI